MEMADNTKLKQRFLEMASVTVLDHGLQYTADKSGSFVIDMKNFSHGSSENINADSRITLQKSLSRKGSQRAVEMKKINNPNTSANDRETIIATSSPRGLSTPEKATVVGVGTADYSSNSQAYHHQISVTTDTINATTEGRCTLRRNSFKRPPTSWPLDPKRVLFLFATLSSMGTILLIYLTLFSWQAQHK